jgi:hypothetical protein
VQVPIVLDWRRFEHTNDQTLSGTLGADMAAA